MHRAFRRLPLSVKLLLIGIIPLLLVIYLSFQVYDEKTQRLTLLDNYIHRIRESSTINQLINNLQEERKYSFDLVMKKQGFDQLVRQRAYTDTALAELEKSSLAGFTTYTFLDKLQDERKLVDSIQTSADQVMHYYTTALYRLNTLNVVSPGTEIYLQPVYKELIAQKLLSEFSTSLGIIRSNIYNVLYTRQYMVETLIGTVGVNDVFKTYETEFRQKAPQYAIEKYNQIRDTGELKTAIDYIDTLFRRFSFDDTYTAETWWQVSEKGMAQLRNLQNMIRENADKGTGAILEHERTTRNRAMILMIIALVVVISVVIYTIYSITSMLNEMRIAAQNISKGAPAPPLHIESDDVIGSLAESIAEIDANHKLLAEAASSIGKGNFNVPVALRSKDDILGNAVMQMKDNLRHHMQTTEEKNHEIAQLAEKYKTIFYNSPLPKWIYDLDTLRFLEVNNAATKVYGYTHEEFLNMTIKDIRPDNDHRDLEKNLTILRSGNSPREKLWLHRKKSGEIITAEVNGYFINYNDKTARMVVINDVSEKILSEKKLKQSHEELRELSSHLQNIREEERANMAREVHDVLGQQITCIKMDVSWLSKQLGSSNEAVSHKMKDLLQLIDHTAITVRKIASELRPSILDDFGLAEALEWQSQEFQKRSGIAVTFDATPIDIPISEKITIGLFRIYQESLTNIARHAHADLVISTLVLENRELILTIIDNGKGFDVLAAGNKKTLGLLGMKERTFMIGGKYEVSSSPGKGTKVTVRVMLEENV